MIPFHRLLSWEKRSLVPGRCSLNDGRAAGEPELGAGDAKPPGWPGGHEIGTIPPFNFAHVSAGPAARRADDGYALPRFHNLSFCETGGLTPQAQLLFKPWLGFRMARFQEEFRSKEAISRVLDPTAGIAAGGDARSIETTARHRPQPRLATLSHRTRKRRAYAFYSGERSRQWGGNLVSGLRGLCAFDRALTA